MILGEVGQSGTFKPPPSAEFSKTTELSSIQQMHDIGVTLSMLAEEYRMHPKMGSALFCNSQPIDILFVLLRDADRTWRIFNACTIPQMPYQTFDLPASRLCSLQKEYGSVKSFYQ